MIDLLHALSYDSQFLRNPTVLLFAGIRLIWGVF